jgi:hypothetical protein
MALADGAGGAIIAWEDARVPGGQWDVYAQRIDANGILQWVPVMGVPISVVGGNLQLMPMLVGDGLGGAIITWYDFRNGANDDIYAQRVNPAGIVQWIANGVQICGAPAVGGRQTQPTIAIDGAGGAIITWYDQRNGNWDIFAQRVNGVGAVQWPIGDVPISTAPNDQEYPKIVSDGAGGAIIAWHGSNGIDNDVYAQRVNAFGAPQWPPFVRGVTVCAFPGSAQELPKIVSDGAGGAIIAWNDFRNLANWDLYAQRLDAAGNLRWADPSGTPISTAAGNQTWQFQFLPMIPDGNGGAIITWTDSRGGPSDIYVQNVRADGEIGPASVMGYWRFEEGAGASAGDASGNGNTGAIQGMTAFVADVPCAAVRGLANASSLQFTPPTDGVEIPDSPSLSPANGVTVEAWVKGEAGCIVGKQLYLAGPPVTDVPALELGFMGGGPSSLAFNLADANGVVTTVMGYTPPPDRWSHVAGTWDAATRVIRLYLDFVEVGNAVFAGPIGWSGSSITIGMRHIGPAAGGFMGDHIRGEIDEVRFSNRARSPQEMLTTPCPLPPLVRLTQPGGGEDFDAGSIVDVQWTALDDGGVNSITLDLSTDGGASFTNIAAGEPNDGTYSWSVPPINSASCVIRVTANDAALNAASDQNVAPFAIHYVAGVTPPGARKRAFWLGDPEPNPFTRAGTISYAVAVDAPIELAVYDLGGRRVRTLARERVRAGEHSVTWNGLDDGGFRAPPGVYLVRFAAVGRTQTKRAVLIH